MCGITGFLSNRRFDYDPGAVLGKMSDALYHRGPDDSGLWLDLDSGVGLAHRRLAIIDLSSEGHQPMVSRCGRYVIVYNGEVYNFHDLRRRLELKGISFNGHSDTEVILAAISLWGIEAAVRNFVGMFAFALWDSTEKILYLVRDRLGIKPLYYGWMGSSFLFGSELKALKIHPAFIAEVDRGALETYLRHNYIPAPQSIYKSINKLPPGCILALQANSHSVPKISRFWSPEDIVNSCITDPLKCSESEAVIQLESLLQKAIGMRMVADVPLGAFLSGGIDSSLVVSIMQSQSERPVHTFTIGYSEEGYNEARHAKAVASFLGTDHTEIYLTPGETMAVIPKLPDIFDEPFADTSQIPTFLVCELARKKVTVSLSGDGGDEIFGGYNHYFWTGSVWKWVKLMPQGFQRPLSSILRSRSPAEWNNLFELLEPFLPGRFKVIPPGERIHKLADVLPARSYEEIYQNIIAIWKQPGDLVIREESPDSSAASWSFRPELTDIISNLMFKDMITFLPDDILVKVDRASMGVSLEARVPLLDHRIVEFAWRLPTAMKIKNGRGKWIIRQVLDKYIPRELTERPKMGFGVPIDLWLRGPLKEWSGDLLNSHTLKKGGFFKEEPVLKAWREHQTGERNWQNRLWNILMFQAWLDKNKAI